MSSIPQWLDPYAPENVRQATAKLLTGTNYRVFFESPTQWSLLQTYRELADLARRHPQDDDAWRSEIRSMVQNGTPENRSLRFWLMGLAQKTANNLGLKAVDYPSVFDQMMADIEALPSIPGGEPRDMALLMWCGAATLTIRGSIKSRTGKTLERSIARAALTIIGLREKRDGRSGDFSIGISADTEVPRETDAEVNTTRGSARIEVGLIGVGNPEIISDKVERMGRNDVVIFDLLPNTSQTWKNAADKGVKLIQMRNNNPVEELRQHLAGLNDKVDSDSVVPETVEERIMDLPLSNFE